jgi:hypothetical protein
MGWLNARPVPDYERSTAGTTLERLPEPLRAALDARVESHLLTLGPDPTVFLTHNTRRKKRRLLGGGDKDTEHVVALVIGPKDVLVASHGEHRGTAVMAVRLEDADMSDPFASLRDRVDDTGVHLGGFPVSGEGGRGTLFVGLGPPDGERARAALEDAIRRAKAG